MKAEISLEDPLAILRGCAFAHDQTVDQTSDEVMERHLTASDFGVSGPP